MTSSQPSLEDQLMPSPDPRAKARKRHAEFWQICWLISLSSLLISLYAVFLSQRLAPTDCQHDLDQAALILADELGKLSVRDGRFGNVGMLDISDGKRSQIGMNKLQATIRLARIVGKQLNYDYLVELARHDEEDAVGLAHRLGRLERERALAGGRNSFGEIVRRVLCQTDAGRRLKSLKIILGG